MAILILNKNRKVLSLSLLSLATTHNISVDFKVWLLRWFSLPNFLFKNFKQLFYQWKSVFWIYGKL